jgi:hypothetical protein
MKASLGILPLLFLPFVAVFGQTTTGSTTGTTPATQGTSATGVTAPGTPAAGTTPASGSQNPSQPDLSVPVDQAKEWTVGFSVFTAEGLSSENAYLAFSLPLLLKDEVSGLETHTYSREERAQARAAIVSRELITTEQGITKIRKERDALLFSDTPPAATALQSVEVRLAAILARLDYLQRLDASKVDVATEKPVKLKEGTGVGNLLDAPLVPEAVYCARQGLDLLIGGSLQEVQGYLVMDAWAYDAAQDKVVFSIREASQRDELYASLPGQGSDLATVILGTEWSRIAFAPEPPSASLYVDGKLVASGSAPSLYLSPGDHDVKITSPGCADETRHIILAAGQESALAVTLVKRETGSVSIASDPTGANLYLDSIWMGRTPFSLEKPVTRSRGILSLPGFYDLPFSVGPDSPPAMSFSLQKDIGPRDTAQKKARDEFYASFGWFAVSLPLPLFSYAFYVDNYVLGFNTGSPSAQLTGQVFYYSYYAGVAISAALFTWMVFRIIHYVSVSNGIAG